MATARDIMSTDPRIVQVSDSAADVARILSSEGIGAVIVCNEERRLQGVITDRDIAVEVVAAGRDPERTTVRDLVDGTEVVTIGADDSVELAVRTMRDHAVRRLPVIDGDEVVGFVSQADVARTGDETLVGELVEAVSAADDNTGRG